jgi:hypothetical protein
MPIEGREGLTGNGIYFWHDYPYRKRNLARDWREHVAQVNGKYAALWPRFLRLLRDPAVHKRLLVSNTQDNLAEFAEGERDFAARFGLTAGFAEELRGCLNSIGACNFSLLFLNRSLYDSFSLAQIPGAPAASRYWGPTGLPTSGFLAAATLLPRVPPAEAEAALRRLVGPWEEGCSIGLCGGLGYVFREGALWAEITVIEDGYVFAFAGAGADRHRSAILEGDELIFSDRRRWRRGG